MIRFFNTLTRGLEPFESIRSGRVGLYTCGPTVYAQAHIGNFRTFVWEDLLRRFLERRGFKVTQVMNITDVDDKIMAGAKQKGISLAAFTSRFEEAFFRDLDTLGNLRADFYPHATEHVPEMLALLKRLQEKGLAYASDGALYYRIGGFPDYGRLSGKDPAALLAGASGRVEADEYDKDDVRDFALWKAVDGDAPGWEGPVGRGRPGWHLECSAMSMKYLGESFDIHTGGVDNIFPHHENEIAQSQGATGVVPAKYWLHAAHLIVNGEKMSKSKGNFFTLKDLTDQGHAPRSLRYLLLSVHHQRVLDLTTEAMAAASQNLARLDVLAHRLSVAQPASTDSDIAMAAVEKERVSFHASLDDDLNVSGALGALFEMVRTVNAALDQATAGCRVLDAARRLLADYQAIFGISLGLEGGTLQPELAALVKAREAARSRRDFSTADRLREELRSRGVLIEDTPQGTRWTKPKSD